jgi:hypothetical protein
VLQNSLRTEKDVELSFKIANDISEACLFDRGRIQQVTANLIGGNGEDSLMQGVTWENELKLSADYGAKNKEYTLFILTLLLLQFCKLGRIGLSRLDYLALRLRGLKVCVGCNNKPSCLLIYRRWRALDPTTGFSKMCKS